MSTDKPRFSVTFTEDSFDKIQKYKQENNISTQSKAVARLVELAISEIESEETKKSPGTAEAAPGEKPLSPPGYSSLSPANRIIADQIVDVLLKNQPPNIVPIKVPAAADIGALQGTVTDYDPNFKLPKNAKMLPDEYKEKTDHEASAPEGK